MIEGASCCWCGMGFTRRQLTQIARREGWKMADVAAEIEVFGCASVGEYCPAEGGPRGDRLRRAAEVLGCDELEVF